MNDEFRPFHSTPYREEPAERQLTAAQMNLMLAMRFVEPVTTEWAAPTVLALRANGYLCFYADYRKISTVTICESCSLPRMNLCNESLTETTVFSTLGANSRYFQIDLDESERDKTECPLHYGL